MKILVLGGTRYVGKRLVDLLLNDGHKVTVASTGNTEVQFSTKVERLTVDRKNAASMSAAFGDKRWDVVFDQICFSEEEAKKAVKALAGKVGRLVFTSSQSVYNYGIDIEESAFDSRHYVANPSNANPYQEGKRCAEQVYFSQSAFPVSAVRFPVVMGPDDPTRRLHWHIARIKFGDPIFFPNVLGRLTVISSTDAASFLRRLLSVDENSPINACSPDPLCLEDLVKSIEEATGKMLKLSQANSAEVHSSYGVEEDWCASPRKALKLGFEFSETNSWVPLLIKEVLDASNDQDALAHRRGF